MEINLEKYMQMMADKGGSDLYLTVGAPPCIRILGKLIPVENEPLTNDDIKKVATSIMNEAQQKEYSQSPEVNLAIINKKLGRFRVNIYQQKNNMAMVMRLIPSDIPSVKQLNLPDILTDTIMEKRGLILFVGATGTGKSTSLAALIKHRNEQNNEHIVTIEDPIEFTHTHKKSLISQREIGTDTNSYLDALKSALRQAPDVIQIGEIRELTTMEYAIQFSESGHLCVSTLHANNANQALERVINFFPENAREQIYLDLSLNLRAIVSQRLIPSPDGKKRFAAFEILLATPLVKEKIKKGEVDALRDVMEKSEKLGMITFDQSLFKLFKEGKIDEETAMKFADSKNNLRLKISTSKGEKAETGHLSIKDEGQDDGAHQGGMMR